MTQANHVFIITLSIIALGFLLKKYGFLTEQEGKTISKFLMHTTFPALMLVSMIRVEFTPSLFLLPLFCIGFCGLMLTVAWFWFGNYSNELRGVLTMGAGTANVGLFGFPIIEGLFGKEALVYAVMYDIGNTIIAFGIVYPLGSYIASSGAKAVDWRMILKRVFSLPPFLAMFVGLSINLLNIPVYDASGNLLVWGKKVEGKTATTPDKTGEKAVTGDKTATPDTATTPDKTDKVDERRSAT
jgi:predicted permease